jgi:hypothetical protein
MSGGELIKLFCDCKPDTFVCDCCEREVPVHDGSDDDMPGSCSHCWAAAHPEQFQEQPELPPECDPLRARNIRETMGLAANEVPS